MSLADTPSSERLHIGFFGRTNAGKSSLINALTGSNVSLVSELPGTTTDPVKKAMELLPIGPVLLIDTPGYGDESALGDARMKCMLSVLNHCDMAVIVIDGHTGLQEEDRRMLDSVAEKKLPCITVYNKCDLPPRDNGSNSGKTEVRTSISVSAKTVAGVKELKDAIIRLRTEVLEKPKSLFGDLIKEGDTVILVCPIDESAPKGRLILPQVLAIRDILDHNALSVVIKETELGGVLVKTDIKPTLVVTDSQVFKTVNELVPADIPLTSFSILMARYKGYLKTAMEGIDAIERLRDDDRILMAEGCTHHRQCGDIGTVKIPVWLREYTDKKLIIETCSGNDFPEDLSTYSVVIHCGGCMLNEREINWRMQCALDQGIPFTNYGTVIAKLTGAYDRSIAALKL